MKLKMAMIRKQIGIMNKKLGWIPSSKRIINEKKYDLFDSLYTKDKQQMFDLENQIIPLIKSRYRSYRIIQRKDTLAIYVR